MVYNFFILNSSSVVSKSGLLKSKMSWNSALIGGGERSRTYQMCGRVAEEKIVGKFFLQDFVCLVASHHTGLCSRVTCSEPSQASPPDQVSSPQSILLAYLSTFFGLLPHWTKFHHSKDLSYSSLCPQHLAYGLYCQ